MKYFITFMFLFLANCLSLTPVSAAVNAKNTPINSSVKVTKKLNLRERLALKHLVFKAKIRIAKDAIIPLALGLIFLVLGIILLISSFGSGGVVALILCIISFSISLVFWIGGLADAFG